MASNRARQLAKLASVLPGANQQVATGLQEARRTQMQETIRQLGPGAGTATAQQLGAQQVSALAQPQLQAAQQSQTQQARIGQMGLQERAREQRQTGFEQQIALSETQQNIADRLSRLNRNAKNQLLDQNLQFQKDQAGRTLFNERQLVDWAVTKAQNAEEYNEYVQDAMLMHDRQIKLLQVAQQKIEQELKQDAIKEKQKLTHEQRIALQEKALKVKKQIRQEEAAAKNRFAKFQTAGGVVLGGIGAAVGGAFGGPVGAAAGAGIGQAVGQAVGGAVASSGISGQTFGGVLGGLTGGGPLAVAAGKQFMK